MTNVDIGAVHIICFVLPVTFTQISDPSIKPILSKNGFAIPFDVLIWPICKQSTWKVSLFEQFIPHQMQNSWPKLMSCSSCWLNFCTINLDVVQLTHNQTKALKSSSYKENDMRSLQNDYQNELANVIK